MPLPIVLVDVAPPDAPAALVDTLLGACNDGLRSGRCASGVREHADVRATASVQWLDEQYDCVRIRVIGVLAPGQARPPTQLCFVANDPLPERWRAAGFTLGTLADREVAPEGELPTVAPPASPRPPPLEPDEWQTWLGLGLSLGPGLSEDDSSWRWGMRAELTQDLGSSPLFVVGSFRYGTRASDVELSARWIGLALGMGAAAETASLRLSLRAELLAETLSVSAKDPSTGEEDAGERSVPGFLAGVSVRWPVRGPVALAVGADGWRLRDGTTVTVFGQKAASWPALGWCAHMGAEVKLH